ncbi:MAG: A/G-specific adenine glycosylase [Candidatus Eisenbacteria bacterium]|nr:A/G-specific adenine glycosylase [Candidatus Eisenbacteria bacterium]
MRAPLLLTPRLRAALLDWYRRERRDLPWRRTRDPYRVWVSEVMLQQTQVATATPYYERFVARFPDVASLAAAPADDVLAAWAGLGYYRRARHLHAAARTVVREHGGRVPAQAQAFAALPGVGRYTLGAVQSIGFGARVPVVDGNVARVLARWSARPLQVKTPAGARALWTLAAALVATPQAAKAPGDWNQALMELGATLCTPRAPRCADCPVRRGCRAFARGTPDAFPPAAARRERVRLRRAVAIVSRGGRLLVARREGALLERLWEPPGVDLGRREDAAAALRARLASLGVVAELRDTGIRVRHVITHRDIEVELWAVVPRGPRRTGGLLRWADPRTRDLALTALSRRAWAACDGAPLVYAAAPMHATRTASRRTTAHSTTSGNRAGRLPVARAESSRVR